MAYFSNGTEGDYYVEKYCMNCVHDINEDCPVMQIHLLYNYDAAGKDADPKLIVILNTLWPRLDSGENGDCKMFIKREG